jgi:hypothetical protein
LIGSVPGCSQSLPGVALGEMAMSGSRESRQIVHKISIFNGLAYAVAHDGSIGFSSS